jgi:hypothetical protein
MTVLHNNGCLSVWCVWRAELSGCRQGGSHGWDQDDDAPDSLGRVLINA